MSPVELDHVKQGVISQPRCLLFPEKELEVPNRQGTRSAQAVARVALWRHQLCKNGKGHLSCLWNMEADPWGCEDNLLTASVTWSTYLPEQGLWGQPVAIITGALHALQLVPRFHSHGGLSLRWAVSIMACLVACLMACWWPAWWPS